MKGFHATCSMPVRDGMIVNVESEQLTKHRRNLIELYLSERPDGEPLEEYLKPVGGGYFFTLPGATSAEDYLGRSLVEGSSSPQASG